MNINSSPTTVVIRNLDSGASLDTLVHELRPYASEILIGGRCSRPELLQAAKRLGASFVSSITDLGSSEQNGKVVVFYPGDGSISAEDIPKLIAPIMSGDANLVIGSRMRGGSDKPINGFGYLGHVFLRGLVRVAINGRRGSRLTDPASTFRATNIEGLKTVNLDLDAIFFEERMASSYLKKGLRVAEIPIHESHKRW